MKNYCFLLLFACLFISFNFAQVGINTEAPQRTLDVNGKTRLQELSHYSSLSNSNDYTQFLIASDGSTDANEKGNVDYLTLEDLRRLLKTPVGFKGTGGYTYVSTDEGKSVTFEGKGLQLRIVGRGTSLIPEYYVQARIIYGGVHNIEVTEFAGDLKTAGGAVAENKNLTINWTDLAWLYPGTSQTGEIVVIFNETAETYKILLATKDGGIGLRHYAFIAQELMN